MMAPKVQPLHAVVKNGRLELDEPTPLPEGQVFELVAIDKPIDKPIDDATDELDDEERARLHASIDRGLADREAGRTVPASEVIEMLQTRSR